MIREFNLRRANKGIRLLYPHEIKEALDREIIGQDDAKQAISVAAFMHILRIISGQGSKSNVLLLGPTGSGKTHMIQVLANFLDLPLAITDATTLTEAGYVGDDVESIVSRLIQVADFNVALAKQGIIYIDEIDKLARTSENRSITRDVSGQGVQEALLKLIEGSVALVPHKSNVKHPGQEMVQIDTKDILFICGGAFEGLDRIIKSRLTPSRMGINISADRHDDKTDTNALKLVEPHDLVKFGLIPELVGRLPVRAVLNPLSIDDLVKIITEPKSAILNQYECLLSSVNVRIKITDEAKRRIAEIASLQKTGARSIRSVIEKLLTEQIYMNANEKNTSGEGCTINIDLDLVNKYFKQKARAS
jgi:ATP-dependent Clp protease ATP-binding subunit ClpX